MVLVIQSYTRLASLMGWSLERALRALRFDYADVLLLGLWNKPVPSAIFDAAQRLRERGLTRFVGLSTHQRQQVPRLAAAGSGIDVIHFRYNAAHPGAEQDIFPALPASNLPGLVSFTATSWKQLLDPKKTPSGLATPTAADCYRFVLSRPEVDVCMTGPSTAAHMDEALRALDAPVMSSEELAWMKKVGTAVR
jgi:aryl-alcohol dehydrogenase-like predicted oxidoreductase